MKIILWHIWHERKLEDNAKIILQDGSILIENKTLKSM